MLNRFILIVFVFLFPGCNGFESNTKFFVPKFTIEEKTTHKIPNGQDFAFGYLEVLENRQKAQSKTIRFPVYIFKSRNPNPQKDPIIYTVGGPGYSTMPSAPYMKYYKYLDDRDFILVEQRGNKYAQPHLDCPEWTKTLNESMIGGYDSKTSTEQLSQSAMKCRERLFNNGIDLDGYNTNEIAADINDLVDVLGIKQYNLLTISYSTKIAQVLMRDYPERIRSVVMDSPLPLEVNYDEESVDNLMSSIDALLTDCENNQSCNSKFPDSKERFYSFLREKSQHPLILEIENPKDGEKVKFYLEGKDIITLCSSASTDELPYLPLMINRLLNNDFETIENELIKLFEGPGNGDGIGMRLSVWCSEENPFNDQTKVQEQIEKYDEVKGLSPAVFEREICDIWNVKAVSQKENLPVKSDIPVFMINGEYDNETPVKWARSMLPNFRNGHHLIFKGWKHTPTTNWGNQCAMQAANDFFNNPEVRPGPSCLDEILGGAFITE